MGSIVARSSLHRRCRSGECDPRRDGWTARGAAAGRQGAARGSTCPQVRGGQGPGRRGVCVWRSEGEIRADRGRASGTTSPSLWRSAGVARSAPSIRRAEGGATRGLGRQGRQELSRSRRRGIGSGGSARGSAGCAPSCGSACCSHRSQLDPGSVPRGRREGESGGEGVRAATGQKAGTGPSRRNRLDSLTLGEGSASLARAHRGAASDGTQRRRCSQLSRLPQPLSGLPVAGWICGSGSLSLWPKLGAACPALSRRSRGGGTARSWCLLTPRLKTRRRQAGTRRRSGNALGRWSGGFLPRGNHSCRRRLGVRFSNGRHLLGRLEHRLIDGTGGLDHGLHRGHSPLGACRRVLQRAI